MEDENFSPQDFVRNCSVWNIDKANGIIDLAIATHSKDAGTDWVEKARAGDKIYFSWKKGNFIVDESADSYLMIGDLSALSHLYIIRRNLYEEKQIERILYSRFFMIERDND